MNESSIGRYKFSEIFNRNSGSISPRIPVRIGGVTLGPGVTFGKGVSFSGVDLSQYIDKDIAGFVENGVFIIKGFYL